MMGSTTDVYIVPVGLVSISPASAYPGGAAFTLTVTGTNFGEDSEVRWNGEDRPTTYVSSTQLTASILANDIATAGTAKVTVYNPALGETSNALNFTIAKKRRGQLVSQ